MVRPPRHGAVARAEGVTAVGPVVEALCDERALAVSDGRHAAV
jgi:hypothetical protein